MILAAEEHGAIVVAMVCDMGLLLAWNGFRVQLSKSVFAGSSNRGLWTSLDIEMDTPWFPHPGDDSRVVYCFADVPHLVKGRGEAHLHLFYLQSRAITCQMNRSASV